MFGIRTRRDRDRKPEADLMQEIAVVVAKQLLRSHVTMPADPNDTNSSLLDASSGGELPIVTCACRGCTWGLWLHNMPTDCGDDNTPSTEASFRHDAEHPADAQLRKHVLEVHGKKLMDIALQVMPDGEIADKLWDFYKAGLSIQERNTTPIAGISVDRRCFQHTSYVYSNHRIRSLVCFCCAQIKLDTGRIRSDIEFRSGAWLFNLPKESLQKCFSMAVFDERYRQSGTALALCGNSTHQDLRSPNFDDWSLWIHGQWQQRLHSGQHAEVIMGPS